MNDAVKKMSAELAAEFAARIQAPDVKAAIEATRSASDADTGTFEVVITTENVDRYNEVIKLDGWDTTNYMNNPVVLLSHDSTQPPIGITTGLRTEDGKMIATGRFAPASASPIAQQIRQLYDLGIMRATSVGFIEKERQGNLITQAELLEFSFVSIPANPYALSTMVKSGISINEFVTKGLLTIKEGETEVTEADPAPAEPAPEPETPTEEAPAEAEPEQDQTEEEPAPDAKALKPLIAELRNAVIALEAAVESDELEGDEDAEAEDHEQKAYREFSDKRKLLQDAATVIGDVLAEARRAVEQH